MLKLKVRTRNVRLRLWVRSLYPLLVIATVALPMADAFLHKI
jgi:hypothetical protein